MFSMSVKGSYGISAAVELALHYKQGPLSLRRVATAQQIPQGYLELILGDLKRHSLVTSVRGQQGGYKLAKNPNQITLFSILSSLEGPLKLSQEATSPLLQDLWKTVESAIETRLSITLEDLLLNKQRLESVTTYSI